MTATLTRELYALRVAIANAREVAGAGVPVRLAIGWNQAGDWIEALEVACELLTPPQTVVYTWEENHGNDVGPESTNGRLAAVADGADGGRLRALGSDTRR